MTRRAWTPINPDGSVNDAELGLPWDTAEPTTWEAIAPKVGNGYSAFIAGALRRAELCPHHRFWLLFGGRMPVSPFPENVTIAAGPITTQAEADRVLPALLAVKAARREVVVSPREVIDLFRVASTGRDTDRNHIRYTDALNGFTYDGLYHTDEADAYERHARLDAVRVRGGDSPMHPAWVRLLRDQATRAGVPFSLAWGEWTVRGAGMSDDQPRIRLGENGGDAFYLENSGGEEVWMQRVGAARSGCSLGGDDYPEVDL